MGNLRAGLIGAGMMGRNHARVLSSMEGVSLVGVADPAEVDVEVSRGLPQVSTVAELIEIGIDLAVVAVPTASHLEVGLALATAGVHTLIEKPLAADASECRRLVEAYQSADLVGCVGHIERCNPALRALRDRLESGALGEIYQVATRRQGPFPSRVADVGVVKDLATHDIDLTAWILQSPYSSVSARSQYKSRRVHEDLVAITGQTADGTIASHLVNWLSPLKERVTVVTGERGTFVADTLHADLTFHANGVIQTEWDQVASFRGVSEGDSIRLAIPKPEPLRVQHERFRDAVLGRSHAVVTMEEGLATVTVAEACLQSAQEGRTVYLDDRKVML